ncbi:hypothetical protein DV736_g2952, partial [Chaetothyriales sp. CBS 134916]
MDPISAAGIGLSVASLALQVFAGCIKGYELFIDAVEMPSKYATMRTQLRIEQSRLLNWGEQVGLLEELLEEQNQALFLQHNLVVEVLLEVHAAFRACLQKQTKYDAIAFANANALTGSSPKQSAFLKRARSIWRSTNKAGARLEWAMVRQDEFEGLLDRLGLFNDRMESCLDRSSIKELHALQQKSNLLLLQVTEQVGQLLILAKSFERTATTAPQPIGSAVVPAQPQSLSRSSTLIATEPDQPSLFSSLADFKAQTMSINEDDERPSMLMDAAIDESSSPQHQPIIESRLSNLAYLLNHPSKPAGFRSPHCLGFCRVENSNGELRYGLVYSTPLSQQQQQQQPKTLITTLRTHFTTLSPSHPPSLNTRIILATHLAESLMYLHSVDWLHKGIQSDSILFFSPSSSQLSSTLVLSGFDFSRPTSSDETTIKSQSRTQDDFYRHPSLLAGGRSTKQHDIYALGIVLVEIALWMPVEDVVLSCLNGDVQAKDRKTKLSRSQIPRIKECLLTKTSRAIAALLAQYGASEESILDATRAASYYDSISGVQLMMGLSSQKNLACKAAFQGLMEVQDPLSSLSNSVILSFLLQNGVDREDLTKVAQIAASAYDLPLMKHLQLADESGYLSVVALEKIAGSRTDWLSPQGLAFLEHIIERAPKSTVVIQLIQDAATRLNITALRMVLPRATDKNQALDAAFTALLSDKDTLLSTEGLYIIQYLLGEGASGPPVVLAAEYAARTWNYEALDIFLRSPIVGRVLPAAFKVVARDKSLHLSSEQLSIASMLVKRGVSTEVLAIAATEAAKLLDFEALKVLSESPLFRGVCDDSLRALLSEDHLWKSPEGLRILRFLLDTGVSQQSLDIAAIKTTMALDVDAIRVVFSVRDDPEIAEQAFSSLIGSSSAWLSPEGVRIADFLVKKNPTQMTIDNAFIQASQYLYIDAVQLLHPYIVEVAVFTSALSAATSSENEWLSKLPLIEQLLDSGVEGTVIEEALIKGARALNLDCLELLSPRVDRWEVYANAMGAAQTNQNWRSSLHVIEFLLRHGASGEAVDTAYISAAGDLDLRCVTLLAGHVQNSVAHNRAFTAAASTEAWLAPGHFELVSLLYNRNIAPTTAKPALVAAARALNVPIVELLAAGASESLVSAVFEAASDDNIDWSSAEGTSILKTLAQKGARGNAVQKALISSAAQFRLDLVKILIKNVEKGNTQCVCRALNQVLATGDQCVFDREALDIIEILIDNGAISEAADNALISAVLNGNLTAVNTLTRIVKAPVTFTEAFAALTQSTNFWLEDQSLGLLDTLLANGASGEPVHDALIDATEQVILGNASMDLIDLLTSSGADINHDNGMVLRLAAKYSNMDLFQFFLSHRPDAVTLYIGLKEALCSDHDEQTVLELFHLVTRDSSLSGVPDVNSDYDLGSPLIFYALQNYPNLAPLIQELCELGANLETTVEWCVYDGEEEISAPEADHIPPLLFAILNGASDEVIVDVLLAYGANFDYLPSKCQANALILAAKYNRAFILSTILDQGAGIAQKDCYDRTALFYAARTGSVSALTSLIKKGPPPNDGSLHEAVRELHPESLKILLGASHDINFPSMKHGGRNPLCELCFKCKGSDDPVGLHNTLLELNAAKASPLRKCRGRTALFFALENSDPVPVVTKLIEVCLWQPEILNDHANVLEKDNYSYSATTYIKKGLCMRPESIALEVLEVLQDGGVQDRYYAKERMKQPNDAVGMPQRIADLDHKKWIRSNRLEEEQEDHERRLRREMEEMTQRDQLVTKRHLLTMEQREDLALQTVSHNSDAHWQGMRFRSLENDQSLRYKDQHATQRLDELAATHRLKDNLDRQVRETQLLHDSRASKQKLDYLDQEQDLKFDGTRAQQSLRLEGISAENVLKNEQQTNDLWFKVARGMTDRADMDYKLQHTLDMSSDRIQTSKRMEDIARDSQQRKNLLEEENRLKQLNYQGLNDDQKLNTERALNILRRENNDETLRTISDKNSIAEIDRQNQLRSSAASDYQKLSTLTSQGEIQNSSLRQKGQIENNSLRDKNYLLQQNRNNELHNLASMGQQRVKNEQDMGEQRIENERGMGVQRIENEWGMGQQRVENTRLMGNQQVLNERNLGDARDFNQQRSNLRNRERIGDNLHGQQEGNRLNRQKISDNLSGQRAGNRLNREKLSDGLRAQRMGVALNRQKQSDNVRAQRITTGLNRQRQSDTLRGQQMGMSINRQKQWDNMHAHAVNRAIQGA